MALPCFIGSVSLSLTVYTGATISLFSYNASGALTRASSAPMQLLRNAINIVGVAGLNR